MAGLIALSVGAGCSSDATQSSSADTTQPAPAGSPPPAKTAPPATQPPGGNTGGGTTGSGTTDDTPKTCMDTKPYDATSVPYHPPAVQAGACSSADVKALNDLLQKNPQTSAQDLKATLAKQNQKCGDCAVGEATAEKWAPIVIDETSAFLNGGGCVSVVSGKDDCGKAYQQWNTCLNAVCAACTDPTEASQCTNDAQKADAPCGAASKVLFGKCGTKINDYLKTCFGNGNIVGTVVDQICGTTSKTGS